jgi:hypothetical protein
MSRPCMITAQVRPKTLHDLTKMTDNLDVLED